MLYLLGFHLLSFIVYTAPNTLTTELNPPTTSIPDTIIIIPASQIPTTHMDSTTPANSLTAANILSTTSTDQTTVPTQASTSVGTITASQSTITTYSVKTTSSGVNASENAGRFNNLAYSLSSSPACFLTAILKFRRDFLAA